MTKTDENTTVVVVGGGVAGLALGNFLLRSGIGCIVLEKHSREHVENRQRAGSLDARGVRMLRTWGLGEVVEGSAGHDSAESGMPLLIDGEKRLWKTGEDDADDVDGAFCPQQILVRNLIKVFLRDGGDLRFEAEDVSLQGLDTERPVIRYRDAAGSAKVLGGDFVAGTDGYHGVSRTAIPADALTCDTHEFGVRLADRHGGGAGGSSGGAGGAFPRLRGADHPGPGREQALHAVPADRHRRPVAGRARLE
jgi:p-hydroxybenzoate 3-monooxygenase